MFALLNKKTDCCGKRLLVAAVPPCCGCGARGCRDSDTARGLCCESPLGCSSLSEQSCPMEGHRNLGVILLCESQWDGNSTATRAGVAYGAVSSSLEEFFKTGKVSTH